MFERKKKKATVSSAEEFALLVGQLKREGYHGIPKAMTPEGLEVLAFDLEQRDKLARARAWLKSEGRIEPQPAKATKAAPKKNPEKKKAPAVKPAEAGLTPEQQAMADRIAKQQGTDTDAAAAPTSKAKKPKRRRSRKKNQNDCT